MRVFIHLFYLFYILSGGFRHYSFNLLFNESMVGSSLSEVLAFSPIIESFLMLIALVILAFPLVKQLHLLMFSVLFCLDIYFQNNVGFTSCFILPHWCPLFFFLFLHFRNDAQKFNLVLTAAILFVCVGFMTSFTAKTLSGWYRWSDPVIYSYIIDFYKAYHVPSLASGLLLNIKSHLFWKLLDYSVLLFQGSFFIVFFRKQWFYPLTAVAVIFHVGILLTLGIGVVFYIYIFFYGLILYLSKPFKIKLINKSQFSTYSLIAASVLMIGFAYSQFDVYFFNQSLPVWVYTYIDYGFALVCVMVYLRCLYNWYTSDTQLMVGSS